MPPAVGLSVPYGRVVLLLLVASSVFFVELGSARLWDRDEPRNSRASHEMLARGDWIVPTFNGELRDHKPILLYWGQMLGYIMLGESEFAARLPSALCALLTILAVAILGSRLSGKPQGLSQEGFWAAGCMATFTLFVMAGRAATPDACLIAFSTLGIASLVTASLAPKHPYSSGRVSRARWLPALFGYTMLGLAALAKGPVGLILPLVVIHTWWLICHRIQRAEELTRDAENRHGPRLNEPWGQWLWKQASEVWQIFNPRQCVRAIIALRTIPGMALSLLVAAPWYVAVGLETDGEFLRGFFLEHNVGRALGSMEGHHGSVLFYPFAFLVGTFPWSMWVIPVVLWCVRSSRGNNIVHRQMVVLSAVWITVYVIAFSAASTKLPSYITPCYAGAALALGGFWRQFESAWARPDWSLRRIAHALTVVVGVVIAVAIVWLSQEQAMPLVARAAWAGVVVTLAGALGLWWERRQQLQRLPMTWLAAAALFQVILFGYGTRSVDAYRDDLALLDAVSQRDRLTADEAAPWICIGGLEPSWVHYLGHEIVEVTQAETDPGSWQRVSEFLLRHPRAHLIVVGDIAFEKLGQWRNAENVGHAARLELREVATAPRFLRPGTMRVFECSSREFRQAMSGTSTENDVQR